MSAPNLPLVFAPEARDDHEHIQSYTLREWGEQQWEDYEAALDQALTTIGDNPHIGRRRDDLRPGVRSYVVRQHVIYYRITESAIILLRIRHGRSDPRRAL